MTKKELEKMTANIIRSAEFVAHYKPINKEKALNLETGLLAKVNMACAMGYNFYVNDMLINQRDIEYSYEYKTLLPGHYIEVVRFDGFRHLVPVVTEGGKGNE